jgi:eukaryotic-like serine/threonine-protein kinase
MDAERWERVQSLFHEAAALPEPERADYLRAACDDGAIVEEVLALLAVDSGDAPLLDSPVGFAADGILGEDEPAGRELGAYVIEQVIGEGGMGVVYRARRRDLGNRVAIKMLRDAWISPSRRERFSSEQRTLANLSHPSIARLLDADTLPDGTPFFVMEFVEGVPITEHCARVHASVPERLRLFRSVCEAVEYAHAQAVVHRDVKPSNILVTPDGTPKLLDFGIAKQIEGMGERGASTVSGIRPMTPAYASPEQLRGASVGTYSDIYSLGVVLYELLTGTRPGAGAEAAARRFTDVVLPIERPSAAARRAEAGRMPGSWSDLDVLCLTALRDDPQRRYRSVEAMIRDIDHYLRGEPLEARPDSVAYRAGKFLRRNLRGVAAATVVLATLAAMSGHYTIQLAHERNLARSEAATAREVTEFLIGLFEASDPNAVESDVLDVRVLLDEGERRVDELASQPAVQAQMLTVLGRVRVALSDYDRADSLLARALELRRARGDDPVRLAETLAAFGALHYHTGEYEHAEAELAEALALQQGRLPQNHPDLATTLDDLGVVVSTRGDLPRAARLFRQALDIRRALYPTPHEDLGVSLNNLAVHLFNTGEYDGALRLYQEALANERAVYGADHPMVATTLANLGKLHEQLESFADAEALLTEALRIRTARLGEVHYETALSHSQLGGLLERIGEIERAEHHLRQALAIRQRTLGPDHPGVATTLNSIGLILQRRGDLEGATSTFRNVIEIYTRSLGAEHRFTGVALCNLAHALHLKGELPAAEVAFGSGLAILEAVHPPDHPELARNASRFGGLLLTLGRSVEAEPLLRSSHHALLAAHGAEHQFTREAEARLAGLPRAVGQ